ncbi:MAG: diguanylate cyclase, partial [Dehalococcoidia bacterium]|nr:diguanylate cyclase [Dehalococcoidia bacterium]
MLQGVVDLIPPAWQYPEITCARITLDGQEFRTENFRETIWKQTQDITVRGNRIAAVEVFYFEERPEIDEGPFLKEERFLIDYIARLLGEATERKQAEEELIRLSNAMKMSTDSIVISDLEARIAEVNEATLRMYGTEDKGDLIGNNSFDLIAPEDREKAIAGAKEVLEMGSSENKEYHIITKDGSTVLVAMSTAIMKDMDGKPTGFVAVSRDISKRKRIEEKLIELSTTDALTGLYNRRHFYETLESEINRTQRYGRSFSMVMLDLDGFKEYNDRFGHTSGDGVLKSFANALKSTLRKTDTAFRYGGDEFLIILPETDANRARQVM